jgi:hypothetical protein
MQEDDERFCFCGKKGNKETASWKYLCGECRQNKPFSFKVTAGPSSVPARPSRPPPKD